MTAMAVLLDIEGTTTSISFVTDVLFPDCARALPDFLARHHGEGPVQAACEAVLADATSEERTLGGSAGVLAVVRRQMAADAKATGLKQLQGLVWEEGYRSGRIRAHVFADVAPAFARWRAEGRSAAIYSSGSILAQKLLFSHSEAGDLTPFISGHYDTTSGGKREAASYGRIAQAWGRAASSIVFCTDQPAEASAARGAGMEAVLLMRPGNAPLPPQQECAVHGDLSRI
jgi:enolase-phosphatase E1